MLVLIGLVAVLFLKFTGFPSVHTIKGVFASYQLQYVREKCDFQIETAHSQRKTFFFQKTFR